MIDRMPYGERKKQVRAYMSEYKASFGHWPNAAAIARKFGIRYSHASVQRARLLVEIDATAAAARDAADYRPKHLIAVDELAELYAGRRYEDDPRAARREQRIFPRAPDPRVGSGWQL